jgi:colanic acid biosynthesis glycosyl transferase WcaI
MRILMLTQHFAPEITAGRFRLEPFAQALAERGHDVTVLCPVPNHPHGEVQEGYRGRPFLRGRVDGSGVVYLRILTSRQKTMRSRLGSYGSYAALATAAGAMRRRVDVVIASSPPLSVAAAGALVAARHRAPLVLDVRDLWPESPVALGELGPGRALRAAERLERWVYAKAACIVTVNDAFAASILEHAPAGADVEVVPNGTTAEWLTAGDAEPDREELDLPEDRFVWAYAGNIGLAHGLEHAVDAAAALDDDYTLLLIGEGPRRAEVARRAADVGASRVEMRPLMSPERAARHLRAADAVLVSESQERTVSAKLYDVCAIGRPVIAACRGELRRVIESEGIALAVEHGDSEALAAAVRRVRSDDGLRAELSANGREFAARNLREHQARRFAEIVEAAGRS